ncbi:unnamed protein product, partial [Staurois parvus]
MTMGRKGRRTTSASECLGDCSGSGYLSISDRCQSLPPPKVPILNGEQSLK